jgi:hypothetical protein
MTTMLFEALVSQKMKDVLVDAATHFIAVTAPSWPRPARRAAARVRAHLDQSTTTSYIDPGAPWQQNPFVGCVQEFLRVQGILA